MRVKFNINEKEEDFKKSAILWRKTVGVIGRLNHSLLGKNPEPAEVLGISFKTHQDMRKFKTWEEVSVFYEYLVGLIEKEGGQPHPTITLDENEFHYITVKNTAEIAICRDGYISGFVEVNKDPWPIMKQLRSLGFSLVLSYQ